jgi:hypothetical protein
MGSLLARHWWAVALRGAIGHSPRFAIAILFGLAVLAFPGISLLGLIVLFGVFVSVPSTSNITPEKVIVKFFLSTLSCYLLSGAKFNSLSRNEYFSGNTII